MSLANPAFIASGREDLWYFVKSENVNKEDTVNIIKIWEGDVNKSDSLGRNDQVLYIWLGRCFRE